MKKKMPDRAIIKQILALLKPHALLLTLSFVVGALHVAGALLAPVIVGSAIDRMMGAGRVDFDHLYQSIINLAIVITVAALMQWLLSFLTHKIATRVAKELRCRLDEKTHRVPLKTIDSMPHGEIVARIVGDTEAICDGLIQGFSQLFTGVATVIGTLAFMLVINAYVALAVVVLTPLSIFVAYSIGRTTHKLFARQAQLRGIMQGVTSEQIEGAKVIKAFSCSDAAEEKFNALNEELNECSRKAMFISSIVNPCTRVVNNIVYAVVTVLGAILTISTGGVFTVGYLSIFLSYANQYTKPFNEITGVITELAASLAAANRVFSFLNKQEISDDKGLPELNVTEGKVEFDNISFAYDEERPLITDLSFVAQPHQRIAIVGPTGCGKTTLINLLMRFYSVQKGEIRVDGTNVRSVKRASLRRRYGMVLQESWIMSGSFLDNIRFGVPFATLDEVKEAAKKAHIHGFISKLEHGYDTVIRPDSLSAGQKQLISIARIMLAPPPMLILDEATSNIDTLTEQYVQSAFASLMKGRTSFVIAHRLSTIKDADTILVMRDGNVVEQGNHEQLMKKENGFYREMYNAGYTTDE